jgi:hypothetical protein
LSPRPGGEADKFGNRYEGIWTVCQLLYVMAGRVLSLQVERGAERDEAVEFYLRGVGGTEVHQVKRQVGRMNGWSLRALDNAGVLHAAAKHVEAGREFHFVSTVPSPVLRELSTRARGSDDHTDFMERSLTLEDRKSIDFLCAEGIWGSPERTWRTLRCIHPAWPDERNLRATNAALCEFLLGGADGAAAAASLGDLIVDNLGRTLDADAIWQRVGAYGLRRAPLFDRHALSELVGTATRVWRAEVEGELLEPVIRRAQVDELVARLVNCSSAQTLVSGMAGGGKTAVMAQTVAAIAERGWPILAIRADRLSQTTTTKQIGAQLDLPASPVATLAAVADREPCLLVVDQLDAVSFVSGRAPQLLPVIVELLRESAGFPNMRIVLACRQFDLDNDERLRDLVEPAGDAQIVAVPPLTDEEIAEAVDAANLSAARLTARQRELLRVPLHLVLLAAAADEPTALDFDSSTDLFDAFWNRKLRAVEHRQGRGIRFSSLVTHLAQRMSEQQRLSLPRSELGADDLERDAEVLASEHVLTMTPSQVGFFHESFFDYAFARHWISEPRELVDFLLVGDQELFRRAQVRQILLRLHDQDPTRFAGEAEALLTHPDIRFHVKDAALAVLKAIRHPSSADWRMMRRLLDAGLPFADRLAGALRTAGWFERLDAEGEIERWLADSEGARHRLALDIMGAAAAAEPGRMAELLAAHRGQPPYASWLRWITRYADLAVDRTLFELVAEAVVQGEWKGHEGDLWLSARGLGGRRPAWGCELLHAFLARRPESLAKDGHYVIDLKSRDHGFLDLIKTSAERAPRVFCDLLLPWMLRAMAAAESDSDVRPVEDWHFSHRIYNNRHINEVDDALLQAGVAALSAVAKEDAAALKPSLELLAGDPHDAAQWLLYEALAAAAPAHADWAADVLLEGFHRLRSGYIGDSYWTTRQLLLAIAGHVRPERHARLEGQILALRLDWEGRSAGWTQFELLSALERDRLAEIGQRRLGELERRWGEPRQPIGIVVAGVPSPIPAQATRKMTDVQWLGAMRKHASSDRRGREFLDGGADELANELQARTKEDPSRYARLALQIDSTFNPRFLQAVLLGLGDADQPPTPDAAFDAIRHAATMKDASLDRWLGRPLRGLLDTDIPDDVTELLLDVALRSESPAVGDPPEITFSNDDRDDDIAHLLTNGKNSGRGSAALTLGDLIVHDTEGSRTGRVIPWLPRLAADPHPAVRACVAHVIAACLRHARPQAVACVPTLVNGPDELLAERTIGDLLGFLIFGGELDVVEPVITRMFASANPSVAEAGGRLAALAGLESGRPDLLEAAKTGSAHARAGAAVVCARRLPFTGNADVAERTVRELLRDPSERVRAAAGQIAPALRGQPLLPYTDLLLNLIASDAFDGSLPQLLITLERATDRIETLVLKLADRFIREHAEELKSIATSYAGDAKQVTELLLRAYAQADERAPRLRALGFLDRLILLGAWGALDAISEAER